MKGRLIRLSDYTDEAAAIEPTEPGPGPAGRVARMAHPRLFARADRGNALDHALTLRWNAGDSKRAANAESDLAVTAFAAPAVAPVVAAPAPAPAAAPAPQRGLIRRMFALSVLAATLAGLGWLGVQIYYVINDGWIAPLHLSPDSDAIAQLRLQHQRHLSELARLDAEIKRFDGELEAIDRSVAKLTALKDSSTETLRWQKTRSEAETKGLDHASAAFARQRTLLKQLYARQQELVTRAAKDLEAGMIDRSAYDREQQALDQLALELAENERAATEARVKREESRAQLTALRAGTGKRADAGEMPEIAAGEEHTARVEIEIQRLQAEGRGERALREAAVASVAAERALLSEVEARPLYRAMSAATDIGFVPYSQLAGIRAGSPIVQCTWGVFSCHEVGHVKEIVPGEVVTQDPWGELARGQYVVLAMDDPTAIRERVLRVRP